MMRASDPGVPKDTYDASYAIAEADRRIRANIAIGTKLKYEAPMAATTFTFEVEEIGLEPLRLGIRLTDMEISEAPKAPQPQMCPSSPIIPQHRRDPRGTCQYLKNGNCYWCCEDCNTDSHHCRGCGEPLDHNGRESNGEPHGDCTT